MPHDTTNTPSEQSTSKNRTPEQRFWQRVTVGTPTECWEWTGATRNGYGVMNIDGKVIYTHRFSCELHHGPLAEGQCALHKCDNRLCCNPDHIFRGTKGENAKDMYAKGRGKGGGVSGRNRDVLRADQVREMRQLAATGIKYPALAKQFGISIPAVCLIVTRKRWKDIY